MKQLRSVMVLAAAMAWATATAEGSEITFAAYTNGCFYSGDTACTPSSSAVTETVSLDSLSFTDHSFPGTPSVGGTLLLDGATRLGSFTHTDGANDNYTNNFFRLLVTFTLPGDATSPPITAELSGKPKAQSNGETIGVNFDNTPIPFSFTNAGMLYSFSLIVDDLTFGEGAQDVFLTGSIIDASQSPISSLDPPLVTPEPASLVLFGTGLTAIAARLRRRSRQ